MEPDDLHLDAEQPFANVRPSTTKNHRQAVIALHADVVEEPRKLPLLPGKVFAHGVPKMEIFKRDFAVPELNSSTPRAGGRIFSHAWNQPRLGWHSPACCHGSHASQRHPADHENLYRYGFAACIRCRCETAFVYPSAAKRLTHKVCPARVKPCPFPSSK
jgi:hypothetical protein